jgi:Trm5-related predicted tRNA methylase
VISATENSNKFPKTRFWKEKSIDNVVTLGPTAEATLEGTTIEIQ